MVETSTRRPYKCTARIALPTHVHARHLRDVISVDREISDKVVKSLSIVGHDDDGDGDDDDARGLGRDGDGGLDDAMRILKM
jgi:hypothetical protein